MSKNDVTGDELRSKPNSDKDRGNYDDIIKKDKSKEKTEANAKNNASKA